MRALPDTRASRGDTGRGRPNAPAASPARATTPGSLDDPGAALWARLARALSGSLVAVAALLTLLAPTPARAATVERAVILDVPYRRQHDGTAWGPTNCGPAAISMVLEAYGHVVPNRDLRLLANDLLGLHDPSTGTRIQDLARIVRTYGLETLGPLEGNRFRRWTVDQVLQEVLRGWPVVAQVSYADLPNHRYDPTPVDHYIVLVGVAGDDVIFNDPITYDNLTYRRLMDPEEYREWAARYARGNRQRMSREAFERAWRRSDFPYAAFSVGPGSTGQALLPSSG